MVAENPLKNMLSRTRGRSAPPLRSLKDASLEHNLFFISIPSDTALSYFCGQRDSTVFFIHIYPLCYPPSKRIATFGSKALFGYSLICKGPGSDDDCVYIRLVCTMDWYRQR